jgi:hypothetical protein
LVVPVEIEFSLVDMLARLRWMERRESYRRAEIARAIERMLADAARG